MSKYLEVKTRAASERAREREVTEKYTRCSIQDNSQAQGSGTKTSPLFPSSFLKLLVFPVTGGWHTTQGTSEHRELRATKILFGRDLSLDVPFPLSEDADAQRRCRRVSVKIKVHPGQFDPVDICASVALSALSSWPTLPAETMFPCILATLGD